MLKIVYSNSSRQLADWLAEQIQSEPLPPFQPETIIVQSNELSRWLALYLASRQGIAANLNFPFPSAYIWRLFRELWPDTPIQSPYDKTSLAWRVYAELPNCLNEPGFETVAAYLINEHDDLRRLELAERIADTFDQYLMYRPDWIQQWEQGDSQTWQGKLWHKLTATDAEPMHRAHLLKKMHELLQQAQTTPAGLPSRLSIFGISALPPVYLHTFELLSRFVDITLFYLSPSEHYWGDIRDNKQLHREQLQLELDEPDVEPGHPLLASLGKQGQEFFRQLQDTSHDAETCFVEPESGSMLTVLKHDMFALENTVKTTVADTDHSIVIHVCHSPMREIEVLHDQLLAMFERDPELTPTDIVVMTPDINVYAPWIEAVFGAAGKGQQIPFSIADSSGQQDSLLLNAFYTLLQLPQSRFDVDTVLALLECPAVQSRFNLDDAALTWIRDWCRETRTRWGLDQDDKVALDLPANAANTWRAGLDRLMLGFAMPLTEPGQAWRLFDEQLAMDGISGERARSVAALSEFVDSLQHWRQRLSGRHTIVQWQSQLNLCLDAFFKTELVEDNTFDYELTAIRTQLERLVESAESATFEQPISVDLMLSWLRTHLEPADNLHRFLGHGVTFCGMVPMRSIPFSMVCLIGLNDSDFPRRQPALSFDLLAHDHREGDRSRRDDDRYLFLESILSADHYLYISYVGASIVDNSEIPPSVLVSDLQDVLSERFVSETGNDILWQVVTHHPLQPFSRRYFDGQHPKLFSFNAAQCPSLTTTTQLDWFDASLPEADDSWRELTRDQLARFFAHPAKFLLRERLGIRLELDEDELENREPFELNGLDNWQLRQWLLQAQLSQGSSDGLKPVIQATGMLPQGYIGDAWYEQASATVSDFVEKLSPSLPTEQPFAIPLEIELDGFFVGGQLDGISQQGLLRYRLAKKKGKDIISAWLDHLLLNIVRPEGVTLETRLILQDADFVFLPVTGPTQLLAELLRSYWQGCHQPLKFFDKSSYEFARQSLNGKQEKAMADALKVWLTTNSHQRGEQDDPYYQLLYRESPLDDDFADIALRIFSPLQQHVQGGKL